jgi:DNA-binding transcriptional LysR family regulator
MALDLRRLRAFKSWMRTGSVSSAAKELGLTQPAVSRLLHDFADSLGLALFHRQGRSLVPTREALALYAEVDQILDRIANIAEASRGLRGTQARQLRIAATPAPALGVLPRAVKAFLCEQGDVEIAVDMCTPRDLHDWTAIGPFDLAIALMPMAHPDAIIKPLARVDAVLGIPPGHELARHDVVARAELRRFPMILPPRYSLICAHWQAALRADKSDTVMDLFTSSSLSACQWAAAGLGVAVVDVLSTVAADLGLVYRPVDPPLAVDYVVMFPKDRRPSALAEAFVARLLAVIDDLAKGRHAAAAAPHALKAAEARHA